MSKSIRKNLKSLICLTLALLCLLFSFPLVSVSNAQGDNIGEDGKKGLSQEQMRKELQSDEIPVTERLEQTFGEDKVERPSADSGSDAAKYVFYRFFRQPYMWDVDKAVLSSKSDSAERLFDQEAIRKEGNKIYVCDKEKDGHLLYHGCNLPAILPGFADTMKSDIAGSPILNAQITNSYAPWGKLGVAADLEEVPANNKDGEKGPDRYNQFTLMEIFGYNLPVTRYVGEWDKIEVYTTARMLSNFGFFGGIKLGAKSIWEGFKGGISGMITGISFNPLKWLGNIFRGAIGSAIIPILDTSDYSVVVQHAWSRADFAKTVYNARYLTSTQVVAKNMDAFLQYIIENVDETLEEVENIKGWLETEWDRLGRWEVDDIVKRDGITTNPTQENETIYDIRFHYHKVQVGATAIEVSGQGSTKEDALKDAYEKAKQQNPDLSINDFTKEDTIIKDEKKEEDEEGTVSWHLYVTVPMYESLHQQFERWATNEDVVSAFEELEKTRNIHCFDTIDPKDPSTYDELEACYIDYWKDGIWASLADNNPDTIKAFSEMSAEFYENDIHAQPQRDISRWVCVEEPEDGEVLTERDIINAPYMFDDENGEINPECAPIRPYVQGGLRGTGYAYFEDDYDITDTRWLHFKENAGFINASRALSFSWLREKLVIATNTLLGFSFADIVEVLGLETLFTNVFAKMRDGVFYPLAWMFISLLAFLLFIRFAKQRDPVKFFTGLGLALIVFVSALFMLNRPDVILNVTTKLPRAIDDMIIELIGMPKTSQQACQIKTGDPENKHIRESQCLVWQAGIFAPYLNAQWGLSLEDLDADKIEISEETRALVGDPGPSENWAIKQLEMIKSGSINKKDPAKTLGRVDPNIYRMVDLMAGPNYGEGKATELLPVWSGAGKSRTTTPILSLVLSFFMLFVIGGLAIYKIEVTISVFIRLLILPFSLLLGLLPDGFYKWRDYISSILALLIRRGLATLMISVTLYVLAVLFGTANILDAFAIKTLIAIVFLYIVRVYWKEMIKKMSGDDDNDPTSGVLSGDIRTGAREMWQGAPRDLRQRIDKGLAKTTASASAYAAGVVTGIQNNTRFRNDPLADGKTQERVSVLQQAHIDAARARERTERQYEKRHKYEGYGLSKKARKALEASDGYFLEMYLSDVYNDESFDPDVSDQMPRYRRSAAISIFEAYGGVRTVDRAYLTKSKNQKTIEDIAKDQRRIDEIQKILRSKDNNLSDLGKEALEEELNLIYSDVNANILKARDDYDDWLTERFLEEKWKPGIKKDKATFEQAKKDWYYNDYIKRQKNKPQGLDLTTQEQMALEKELEESEARVVGMLYVIREQGDFMETDYENEKSVDLLESYIRHTDALFNTVLESSADFSGRLGDRYRQFSKDMSDTRRRILINRRTGGAETLDASGVPSASTVIRPTDPAGPSDSPTDPTTPTGPTDSPTDPTTPTGPSDSPVDPSGTPSGYDGSDITSTETSSGYTSEEERRLRRALQKELEKQMAIDKQLAAEAEKAKSKDVVSYIEHYGSADVSDENTYTENLIALEEATNRAILRGYETPPPPQTRQEAIEAARESKEIKKTKRSISGFINEMFGTEPKEVKDLSLKGQLGDASGDGLDFIRNSGKTTLEGRGLHDYRDVAQMGIKDKISEEGIWGRKRKPVSKRKIKQSEAFEYKRASRQDSKQSRTKHTRKKYERPKSDM